MLCLFNSLKDGNVSNYIQQRQCRYKVTMRCVSATTVAVEKQLVLHILSACLHPLSSSMQCARAVLYCHLWPVRLYNFSTLSHKGHDFQNKVTERKMFRFSE